MAASSASHAAASAPAVAAFKFTLRKDMRRWTPSERPTLAQLLAKVAAMYELPEDTKTTLKYTDVDGDQVTLASEADVDELFRQMLPVVRVTVSAPDWSAARAEDAEARKAAKKAAKEAQKREAWRAKLQAKAARGNAHAKAKLAELEARLAREASDTGSQQPALSDLMHDSDSEPETEQAAPTPFPAALPQEQSSERKAASDEEVAVHPGITCDGCQMSPLRGPRFKSKDRTDFDVCQRCKAKEDAPWARDAFTLIERPCQWRGMGRAGMWRNRQEPVKGIWRAQHKPGGGRGPFVNFPRGFPAGNDRECFFHLDAMPRARNPLSWQHPFVGPPPPFQHPGHHPPPFHHAPAPMDAEDSADFGFAPPAGKASKAEARFVLDVSVPDGTEMAAGQRLVKTWRMRNSGSVPWTTSGGDLMLLHVGGDPLAAKPVTRQLCQPPAPGQEVEVSVELVAPSQPGRYVSYFRLAEEGVERHQRFGQRVWASIVVTPPKAEPGMAEDHAQAPDSIATGPDPLGLASALQMAGLKPLPEEQHLWTNAFQEPLAEAGQSSGGAAGLYPVPLSTPGPSSSSPPPSNVGDEWVDIPKVHEA